MHLEEKKCQDFQGLKKKKKNTCFIVTDCYLIKFTPIFMSPLTFFTILTCKRHNFIVFKKDISIIVTKIWSKCYLVNCLKNLSFTELTISRFVTNITSYFFPTGSRISKDQFDKAQFFLRHPLPRQPKFTFLVSEGIVYKSSLHLHLQNK